jgi:beta-N-acetylhexosaminidase
VIGDRAFGASPDVVSELGLATIGGLQDHRVVACGKHFPGHGDTNADSHKELPVVAAARERLDAIELPPFRAAAPRVAAMMTAHVLYRSLDERYPATMSTAVIGHLLRREIGYEGVVLTDDLEMHAIIDHYGIEEATVQAILAGCDMPLICKDRNREIAAFTALDKAVADGTVSTERLEQSLARVAKLKARFLLPARPVVISDAKLVVGCRSHRALLQSIEHMRERLDRACV